MSTARASSSSGCDDATFCGRGPASAGSAAICGSRGSGSARDVAPPGAHARDSHVQRVKYGKRRCWGSPYHSTAALACTGRACRCTGAVSAESGEPKRHYAKSARAQLLQRKAYMQDIAKVNGSGCAATRAECARRRRATPGVHSPPWPARASAASWPQPPCKASAAAPLHAH